MKLYDDEDGENDDDEYKAIFFNLLKRGEYSFDVFLWNVPRLIAQTHYYAENK